MRTFEFIRPSNSAAAIKTASQAKTAQQGADVRFVAGGTTLLDLMKLNVETPTRLVDINRLPLDKIEVTPDGRLSIGATVRNSDLAYNATVKKDYPVLSQAILSGASAQLRNMATTAGNLVLSPDALYWDDITTLVAAPARLRRSPSGPRCCASNLRCAGRLRWHPLALRWGTVTEPRPSISTRGVRRATIRS